jgi:hypothetical protein
LTRDVSAPFATAVVLTVTRPIYLVHMIWGGSPADVVRVATWDTNISWNSLTWLASGVEVENMSLSGGVMILPNGDDDPWRDRVMEDGTRDRTIEVFEYHTDFSASPRVSDAELIFSGIMDESVISHREIRVSLIEGRSNKGFPQTSIGPPDYNHLLPIGARLMWGPDIATVI